MITSLRKFLTRSTLHFFILALSLSLVIGREAEAQTWESYYGTNNKIEWYLQKSQTTGFFVSGYHYSYAPTTDSPLERIDLVVFINSASNPIFPYMQYDVIGTTMFRPDNKIDWNIYYTRNQAGTYVASTGIHNFFDPAGKKVREDSVRFIGDNTAQSIYRPLNPSSYRVTRSKLFDTQGSLEWEIAFSPNALSGTYEARTGTRKHFDPNGRNFKTDTVLFRPNILDYQIYLPISTDLYDTINSDLYDANGRLEWSISYARNLAGTYVASTGSHRRYDPFGRMYRLDTVSFLGTILDYQIYLPLSPAAYSTTSSIFYDSNNRVEWIVYFNRNSMGVYQASYGYHSLYDPTGKLYRRDTVQFNPGFFDYQIYPPVNIASYSVTSSIHYDSSNRPKLTVYFTRNSLGIYAASIGYLNSYTPTGSIYHRDTLAFRGTIFDYQINLPLSEAFYDVTGRTLYDQNGRVEWTVSFSRDTAGTYAARTGIHSIYDLQGKLTRRDSVSFKPFQYQNMVFLPINPAVYDITSSSFYGSNSRIEWFVQFARDTAGTYEASVGYRYIYNASGAISRYDYVRFLPLQYEISMPISPSRYTVISSNSYDSAV